MKNELQNIVQDEQYQHLLQQVISRAQLMQYRTAVGINQELIRFYWSMGEDIANAKAEVKWGSKFYQQFSRDLLKVYPDRKGFSVRNLQYIHLMYRTFSPATAITPQPVAQLQQTTSSFTPQPVAQTDTPAAVLPVIQTFATPLDYISLVPWGHIRYILDKGFTSEKALFYVLKTIEYGWSRNMLLNMMSAELYEAEGKSINNFPATMPKTDSDCANEIVKNPYHLDFLQLR